MRPASKSESIQYRRQPTEKLLRRGREGTRGGETPGWQSDGERCGRAVGTDGQTDGRTNERTDERTDGRTNGYVASHPLSCAAGVEDAPFSSRSVSVSWNVGRSVVCRLVSPTCLSVGRSLSIYRKSPVHLIRSVSWPVSPQTFGRSVEWVDIPSSHSIRE